MRRVAILVGLALIVTMTAYTSSGTPAAGGGLTFRTVKLPYAGATEPRVDVGPDDTLYAVANVHTPFGVAALYSSTDHGLSWTKTGTHFPGQQLPTPDLDIATLPDHSIVASELDSSLSFPTAVTTDAGLTWTRSVGANRLTDLDRQWLAYGPRNPRTGKYEVYLIFHNLFTGFASHNMFVATSVDGGRTFGVPVPVTLPGSPAWLDLQCADSGGPTGILVNHKTNELYAIWRSRSYSVGPFNTGGCGASAFQKPEVNIIASTRIWVARAKVNRVGAWQASLAIDESKTGHIVAMQNLQSSLANDGSLWIGYPESPRPYPDYSGAAVRLTHAPADLAGWSKPITLVAGGGVGNILTHAMAGDAGKVAVAYFHGEPRPGLPPIWRLHVAQTLNATSATPTVTDTKISNIPAEAGTASALMGICTRDTVLAGILNGLLCSRSSDIWGTVLDHECRMVIVWPAEVEGPTQGTYASTQTGGPRLCTSRRV